MRFSTGTAAILACIWLQDGVAGFSIRSQPYARTCEFTNGLHIRVD